jgi:hypothetical protein
VDHAVQIRRVVVLVALITARVIGRVAHDVIAIVRYVLKLFIMYLALFARSSLGHYHIIGGSGAYLVLRKRRVRPVEYHCTE